MWQRWRVGLLGLAVPVALTACSGPSDESVEQDLAGAPTLNQFVLYADRSIHLGAYNSVDRDVGVATQAITSFGTQLVIGEHASGHDAYSPTIGLGDHASMHDLFGSVQNNGGTFHESAAYPSNAMPPPPLAPTGTPGTTDVTVGKSERLALAPGAYRNVHVDGTLVLASGTYSFADVSVGSHAAIRASSGTVEVRVAGRVVVLDQATIAPSSNSATASTFVIYVASADTSTQSAVSIGSSTSVRALVAVPHGTLQFSDHASGTGAFAAFDIVAGGSCSFQLQDGFNANAAGQHGSQQLNGYLRSNPTVDVVPPSTMITISVGLPAHDLTGLKALIHDVSDPNSSSFRQYLSADQFKQRFGGTDADYAAIIQWAITSGLSINHTFANQLLLSVRGTALQVGNALHANLVYRQRADGVNTFVSVDREPSVDLAPTVLWISNLTNVRGAVPLSGQTTGRGPGQDNFFMAQDLRTAYLDLLSECEALDGTGQVVGIYNEQVFDPTNVYSVIGPGYVPQQDIPIARSDWPHPSPTVIPVHVDDPDLGGTTEVNVDIDMVVGIAPNAQVILYTGGDDVDDTFCTMANDTRLNVVSVSYGLDASSNMQQSLYELASRGVSVFVASGDNGDVGDPENNDDLLYQTLVGGTVLDVGFVTPNTSNTSWLYCQTDPNSPPMDVVSSCYYSQEETWVVGTDGKTGTGGGIMTSVDIPDYQQGVSMALNGGSTSHRNYPDVAAVATGVLFVDQNAPTSGSGTSIAAPVWAAFTALSNQYAANHGEPGLGFANPTLYAVGLEPDLAGSFHDINDGVYNSVFRGFRSVSGYDLATGWGSPTCQLIQQLGTHHPTIPQTFGRGLLHIANGDDGVDDDSTVKLIVHMKHSPPIVFPVKAAGEGGWGQSREHDRILSFDPKVSPFDVDYVTLSLHGEDDDWDVAGVQLFLAGVRVPYGCVVNVSGGDAPLPDGNYGAFRLSSADNGGPTDENFTSPGCPAWGGAGTVGAFEFLDFIFDTADDDMNSDSTLIVDIFDPNGTVLEEGILHHNGDPTFIDHTEWHVRYQLQTPRTAGQIGTFKLTLQAGPVNGEDEWHVQAVNVYGVQGSLEWASTCLSHGTQKPDGSYEFKFDTDDGPTSNELPPKESCQ